MTSSKECPTCGLIHPESAMLCECGFDFERNELTLRRHGGVIKDIRTLLILESFLLGGAALLFLNRLEVFPFFVGYLIVLWLAYWQLMRGKKGAFVLLSLLMLGRFWSKRANFDRVEVKQFCFERREKLAAKAQRK